jgi:hypothetical protein
MPQSSRSKKKRKINCSVRVSADIYEELVGLQGFLQLKERRKRSMDELMEFILSFMPDLETEKVENMQATDPQCVVDVRSAFGWSTAMVN